VHSNYPTKASACQRIGRVTLDILTTTTSSVPCKHTRDFHCLAGILLHSLRSCDGKLRLYFVNVLLVVTFQDEQNGEGKGKIKNVGFVQKGNPPRPRRTRLLFLTSSAFTFV